MLLKSPEPHSSLVKVLEHFYPPPQVSASTIIITKRPEDSAFQLDLGSKYFTVLKSRSAVRSQVLINCLTMEKHLDPLKLFNLYRMQDSSMVSELGKLVAVLCGLVMSLVLTLVVLKLL